MKKLVLVLVSILILVIFIAFNYLLWDKENRDKDIENLKYININSNSRINAYERDIKSLEEQVKLLRATVAELEESNKVLEEDKLQLEKRNTDSLSLLEQKNAAIDILKHMVDMKELGGPVVKWVEAIDSGKYEEAYKLQGKKLLERQETPKLNDFAASFKNSVKSIKIKDIRLVDEGIPENKKGDIIFSVILEVDKTGSESKTGEFKKGSNEKFFTVDFDVERDYWIISDILDSL